MIESASDARNTDYLRDIAERRVIGQDELAELTGVADALFCHAKRFLVVASSHEGIEALSSLAIDQ